jgi:hypothetical protein
MSYKSSVLADSPLHYWTLEDASGSTTCVDSGSTAHTLTVTAASTTLGGTPTIPGDSPNTAAVLSSATTNLYESAAAYTAQVTPLSMEAWIKTTIAGSGGTYGSTSPFVAFSNGNGYYAPTLGISGGKVVAYTYTGGAQTITSSVTVNDGNWHHIVLTITSANAGTLYVDGVSSGTNASFGGQSFNGDWYIGGANSFPGDGFSGTVAHVAIYTTALSATQVSDHYNTGVTAPGALAGTSRGRSSTYSSLSGVGFALSAATTIRSAAHATLTVVRNFQTTSPRWPNTYNQQRLRTSVNARSGASGTLQTLPSGTKLVSGAVTGQSHVQGALAGTSTSVSLQGSTGGRAGLYGTTGNTVHLRGQATGRASAEGSLPSELHASVAGRSQAYAALHNTAVLSGATAGTSRTSGLLGITTALSGETGGRSAAYGQIVVASPVSLQGATGGDSKAFGQLALAALVALSGSVNARSSAQAAAVVHAGIAGAVTARSGATGNFTVTAATTVSLTGATAGRSTLYAQAHIASGVNLAGAAAGKSVLYAQVEIITNFVVNLTDSISTSDQTTRTFLGTRGIPDSTSLSDATQRTALTNRGLSDVFTFSDAISAVRHAQRALSDTVPAVTDLAGRLFVSRRGPSDQLYLADNLLVLGPPIAPVPFVPPPPAPNSVAFSGWSAGSPFMLARIGVVACAWTAGMPEVGETVGPTSLSETADTALTPLLVGAGTSSWSAGAATAGTTA